MITGAPLRITSLSDESRAIVALGVRQPQDLSKLTTFMELESGIRACGELNRQAGEIFPRLPGYETKHSTSSNHICARLLCARPKHAGRKSATGRRLSRRQHGGRPKRPFESQQRHIQYGRWFLVAQK